jgi:hypothetical protein
MLQAHFVKKFLQLNKAQLSTAKAGGGPLARRKCTSPPAARLQRHQAVTVVFFFPILPEIKLII